jgi:hypothetical protein
MQKHPGSLDEALLSNCFAYIKKASDDGIQEVVYALQKVLQLYAAQQLGKADTKTEADSVLAGILTADETRWEAMVEDLATSGWSLTTGSKLKWPSHLASVKLLFLHAQNINNFTSDAKF